MENKVNGRDPVALREYINREYPGRGIIVVSNHDTYMEYQKMYYDGMQSNRVASRWWYEDVHDTAFLLLDTYYTDNDRPNVYAEVAIDEYLECLVDGSSFLDEHIYDEDKVMAGDTGLSIQVEVATKDMVILGVYSVADTDPFN